VRAGRLALFVGSQRTTFSAVLVTALFNFYNRLVEGVGLALPEGYVAEAAKRLSTQGCDVFA
jgi:hypothetical protein